MSRASTLVLVLSALCLAFAALGAAFGLSQAAHIRSRFLRLSGWYAAGGSILLGLRLFVFVLPERLKKLRRPLAPAGEPPPGAPPARQGGVLLLVLVLLGLIAGMVLQAQVRARGALLGSRRAAARLELRRAAADSVRAALQRLADDEDLRADATNDLWAAAEDTVNPLGIATLVRVTDEDRLFDLNNLAVTASAGLRAPADIVGDILAQCGVFYAAEPVGAMADWMDGDDAGLRESAFYASKDPPYRCANRPLYDWTEVLLVEGWTRELFRPRERTGRAAAYEASAADCLTVLPVPRTRPLSVNVNTAAPEVLRAVLGLANDAVADSILALRAVRPIRSIEALSALGDPLLSAAVGPYLDVRSRFFRVRARAYRDGESLALEALAQREPSGRVR
jgi:general secretion pathway protein K